MELAKEYFFVHGGHEGAGGFTILRTHVHMLEEALCTSYETLRVETEKSVDIETDAELTLADVNRENADAIAKLCPYGVGNAKPVFRFKNVIPKTVRQFGKTKEHLEVMFTDDSGVDRKAISFFAKSNSFTKPLTAGEAVDLVASFDDSEYAGRKELRLKISDIV